MPSPFDIEQDNLREQITALHSKLDLLLNHCPDPECTTCSTIICPHQEPLHFHHDGCPACSNI